MTIITSPQMGEDEHTCFAHQLSSALPAMTQQGAGATKGPGLHGEAHRLEGSWATSTRRRVKPIPTWSYKGKAAQTQGL